LHAKILAVALGAGLTFTAPALPPARAAPATPAPGRQPLNPLARDLITPRMSRHGGEIQELAASVTMLRHDRTRELALRIASEPRLVKLPGAGANELESTIPDSFFTLQDQARAKALALAAQAAKGDDRAVGRAFGELQQVCVDCHASYLPRPPEAPRPPASRF
jgi:hypothetical protein